MLQFRIFPYEMTMKSSTTSGLPQDNMNAMLEGVTVTGRDGKVTNLEQVRNDEQGQHATEDVS